MPDVSEVPPRPSERLLIESVGRIAATRVCCTSLGRAQFAAAVASQLPTAEVQCQFLDLYQMQQAQQAHSGVPNLRLCCQADFADGEFDLVAFPITAQGDAELTRDWLQAGQQSLRMGGSLWAATDNPHDRWLHAELEKLFAKVSCERLEAGVLYRANKTGPLRKVKDFSSQFAFRDQGRLLKVFSRPGVFSHRRIDTGARALIEVLEVQAGERVLDLGCGSGVVSVAAAARADAVHVLAVDANPRAVECTRRSAHLNGLTNVQVLLEADGRCDEPGTYDLVLANPPYFSRHRIDEIFLRGAARALRAEGQLLLVTKRPDWFREALAANFRDVQVVPSRDYFVLSGRRRPADG